MGRHTFFHLWWVTLSLFFLYAVFTWLVCFPSVRTFDLALLQAIQNYDVSFLKYSFLPFVLVGSVEISVLALFLISARLYQKGKSDQAYLTLAALVIVTAIEFLMKHYVPIAQIPETYRGRFPWVPIIGSISFETIYSFPSGHALRSSFLFGVLFLWFEGVRRHIFLWLVLIYLVFQIVGMNYYGFHWASDVIGGYFLAAIALYFIQGYANNGLQIRSESNSQVS